MLGMYVHTHWGYHRPYAARAWTDADWEGYLQGLATLGFDFLMIWPQLDCMPPEPTPSDRAWLARVNRAIGTAQQQFGMRVAITVCANTIGNEKAAGYPFESRPYFVCEKKVNPSDPAEVAAFLDGRRVQLSLLSNADALAVIDSDPGGYVGSTNAQFVELCRAQIEAMRSANPEAEFVYWMLAGWESYNAFWDRAAKGGGRARGMWSDWKGDDFLDTLALMKERIAEPWWLFGWRDQHLNAIETNGLSAKAMCYPYGIIEGEPTFPFTNCCSERVAQRCKEYDRTRYPLGIMGNAQTHCLQLPHTYMFAHFARGGAPEELDLHGFAEELLPGHGATVANAWNLLETDQVDAQLSKAAELHRFGATALRRGRHSGLLFSDPNRFTTDLAMNLEVRAVCHRLRAAIDEGDDTRKAVQDVLEVFKPYQERVGFVDVYAGPLRQLLNDQLSRLGDDGIDAAQADFGEWQHPERRNGIVPRIIAAMRRYCDTH